MTLPTHVRLLSQRIDVREEGELHMEAHEDGAEPHQHRVYGVYDEEKQVITLDAAMGFERQRETFLHENLHAMCAVAQLDGLSAMEGFDEHWVSSLSPVMLSWMRDNPAVMKFLMETQP